MILTVCANPSVDSFWHIGEIEKKTTNRSAKETFYPGGKGIHVAFALNELGQKVASLGIWGGQTGDWLKKECKKKDITSIGPSVEQWTRICVTAKSSTDWNDTELLGGGPKVTSSEANDFIETYQTFIEHNQPDAITISGSTPRGFDNSIYYDLITIAKNYNISSFLDASGELLNSALPAHPYCVHINQHEGREFYGTGDPIEIARRLSNHCTIAAVTAGADGLYLQFENKLYHAFYTLKPSRIISTVGSGDCLLAGLCLATLGDQSPAYWAKLGAACGSANCIHPPLGMLKSQDVTAILKNVELERIEI